jgi:hypothetical protein
MTPKQYFANSNPSDVGTQSDYIIWVVVSSDTVISMARSAIDQNVLFTDASSLHVNAGQWYIDSQNEFGDIVLKPSILTQLSQIVF